MSEDNPCIVCGSQSWKELLKLKSLPVFPGCTKSIEKSRKDLEIIYCQKCGLIRKANNIPSLEYKEHQHKIYYPSTRFIKQKVKEDRQFYNFLRKDITNITTVDSVLDIGCHDGHFLSLFKRQGCELFGCEPSFYATVARENYGVIVKQEPFRASLYGKQRFDLVVLRNILCVLDDPLSVLKEAVSLVKSGGYIAIENINIDVFLRLNVIPPFSHELIYYFSPDHIKILLSAAGAELLTSIQGRRMYFLAKKTLQPNIVNFSASFKAYVKKVSQFQKEHSGSIFHLQKKFHDIIQEWRERKWHIAFYGAGASAQSTISFFNIMDEEIDCIIDSDPYKTGSYLRGTGLKIFDPSILKKEHFDVIVITSFYQEEILNFLKKMKVNSKILILYPKVEYVK